MNKHRANLVIAVTACAAMIVLIIDAKAAKADEVAVVTAESHFGHGTISAKTHATALGSQVQLPGGTWTYCRRSCSETLRVETIDFFESNVSPGTSGLNAECGIFGCISLPSPSDMDQK